MQWKAKENEDSAQKGSNKKALWGPFFETSLGAPGKYPLLPHLSVDLRTHV